MNEVECEQLDSRLRYLEVDLAAQMEDRLAAGLYGMAEELRYDMETVRMARKALEFEEGT